MIREQDGTKKNDVAPDNGATLIKEIMKNIYSFLIVIAVAFACSHKGYNSGKQYPGVPLSRGKEIARLDVSMRSILYSNGRFYSVQGAGKHRLSVYDSDFNLLFQTVSSGKGPGEIERPIFPVAASQGGKIALYDASLHRVQLFSSSGEFLSLSNLDSPPYWYSLAFIDEDSILYYRAFSQSEECSLESFDTLTEETRDLDYPFLQQSNSFELQNLIKYIVEDEVAYIFHVTYNRIIKFSLTNNTVIKESKHPWCRLLKDYSNEDSSFGSFQKTNIVFAEDLFLCGDFIFVFTQTPNRDFISKFDKDLNYYGYYLFPEKVDHAFINEAGKIYGCINNVVYEYMANELL